jgi:3-hydroxybutyryl-CoA dehydrogenase
MEIKKVGVLGCGLMGSGIAQVAAMAGCDVTVLEQEQKFLDKGFAGIEKSLSRLVERGTAKAGRARHGQRGAHTRTEDGSAVAS